MPTQRTRLKMLSIQEPSINHDSRTDTGSDCHHDYIVLSPGRTLPPFSGYGQTSVIIHAERNFPILPCPFIQTDRTGIIILLIRRDYPVMNWIYQPGKSQADTTKRSHINTPSGQQPINRLLILGKFGANPRARREGNLTQSTISPSDNSPIFTTVPPLNLSLSYT